MSKQLIADLKWRGVVKKFIHIEQLANFSSGTRVYCGIDPTMSAIQIGNLLQLIMLLRFQKFGYQPIVVIGGATARIGDPSGRNTSRNQLTNAQIEKNSTKIRVKIKKIFPQIKIILNNDQWLTKISWIDFIQVIGQKFNVAQLLTYDNIQRRLSTGLSVAEFSYAVAQAYDFGWLYKKYNCCIQIGGSDQWTNITSGLSYIQKEFGTHVKIAALTTNLVVNQKGEKLGKSANNTIFLDSELTSKFNFFNFFYNQPDQMVDMYLKFFTFIDAQKLKLLTQKHQLDPRHRIKQNWLVESMFSLVYGVPAYQEVKLVQRLLFQTPIKKLTIMDCNLIYNYLPHYQFSSDQNLVQVIQRLNICSSQTELKKLISKQGIRVNDQLLTKLWPSLTAFPPLHNKYWLIKKGKQHFFIATAKFKLVNN